MKLNSILGSHKQDGGFTLIEMLIVVAIIGILVAIAVPALNTAKADAQAAKRDAISAGVATAKVRYALANDGVEGTSAAFADIAPYLLVNGQQPASFNVIGLLSANKAGQNITDLGTYPDTNGAANAVTWGLGAASE